MNAREKCYEIYGKTIANGVIDLFLESVWHERGNEPCVGAKIITYTDWGGELKVLCGEFIGGRLMKVRGWSRPWVITGKWAYADDLIPDHKQATK